MLNIGTKKNYDNHIMFVAKITCFIRGFKLFLILLLRSVKNLIIM